MYVCILACQVRYISVPFCFDFELLGAQPYWFTPFASASEEQKRNGQ